MRNNARAKVAVRKLQRAFRTARVRAVRGCSAGAGDVAPSSISADRVTPADASAVSIQDGSHKMDVSDVVTLYFSQQQRGDWWYRTRKRWGRRHARVESIIAAYGDTVSMSVIFPAMLVIFFFVSMVAPRK